jgi:hypothetical protein
MLRENQVRRGVVNRERQNRSNRLPGFSPDLVGV